MEFTKKFLRAKSPCADGFRWFSRHVEDGSGYQEALDTLVSYMSPGNVASARVAQRMGAVRDDAAPRADPTDLVYRHRR